MKKIFYLLASAIVALGAVACQNDINEAITPEEGSQISFKVSFDESTRVAMGALADGKLPFVFDGNGMKGGPDSLYVGYLRYNTLNERYYEFVKLVNSTEQPDTFTLCDSDNLTRLEQWVEEGATDIYAKTKGRDNTVSNQGASGLFFKSEQFKLVEGENQISLSLACPAFYFQVLEGVEVEFMVKDKDGKTLLWNEQSDKMPSLTFGEGVHIVGIDESCSEAVISYSVDGVVLKEKALNNLAHKVYNLGTLGTDIATYNGVNYTNLHDALDVADGQEVTLLANATLAKAGTFKINTNGHTLTISSDFRMTDNGDGTITVVAIEWAVKVGEAKYEDFTTAWATIQDGDVVTLMKDLTITSAEAFTIPADMAITLDLNKNFLTLDDTVSGNAMIQNNGGLTIKNGQIFYSYNGEADNTTANYVVWNKGELNINKDATIRNTTNVADHAHYIILADEGSTLATSGTFTSNGAAIRLGAANVTINISGGTITCNKLVEANDDEALQGATIEIIGGTFSDDINEFVADGYKAVYNGRNWVVKEWIPVAMVGDAEYDNLGDAIAIAKATGEEITLVGDAVIAQVVNNLKINLNGRNLTAAEGFTLTIDKENNTVTVEKQKDLIYLRPGSMSGKEGWFAAYFFESPNVWVKMIQEGDRYVAEVPDGVDKVHFYLMNPNDTETLDWSNVAKEVLNDYVVQVGYTYNIVGDDNGYFVE